MKLVQEIMFGCILYYVFIHWYRRESKEDDDIVDTLPDGQLHS